ncbi:MAG: ExeM/NucH family extracellular endonuclease [Comamonas sp.]
MFALRSIASACRTPARLSPSLFLAGALLLAALPAAAQTALQAGDVAVVGFRSDTPDGVSLVLLRGVDADTEIRITDNGWLQAGGFRSGEGVLVWKATEALPAGTVVHLGSADTKAPTASAGSVSVAGSFNLASGGDSLIVYQGSEAAPSLLYAVNNTSGGGWQADAANSNTSALPPGLVAGTTALALAQKDNYAYSALLRQGTAAELRATIGAAGNWSGDSTAVPAPPDAFDVTDGGGGGGGTTPPGPVAAKISAVQGAVAASPLKGKSVVVKGIVTAHFPQLNGFFLQSLPEDDDGDAATSEGVFAYYGNQPVDVGVGQVVQLTATVDEYKEQTQLGNITGFSVLNGGALSALPAAVELSLPLADAALWERYEGMRVRVRAADGPLVVTDNYTLGRFGTVVLASGGLLPQYTEQHAPSYTGNQAFIAAQLRNQIIVDDGNGSQNPAALPGRGGQPLSAANPLRAGDRTPEVVGILDQFVAGTEAAHQTSYRLQPTQAPVYEGDERPTVQALQQAVGEATVKVASANVLNFFTTLGKTRFSNPFGDSLEGRGADNAQEFARQRDKVVANLLGLDADVYGLMEIQNNGFADDGALATLVAAMNQRHGSAVFAFVRGPFDAGGGKQVPAAGRDAISVALVYRQDRVRPVGKAAVADDSQYDAFSAAYGSRVPLAQSFEVDLKDGGTERFTVVANHLKSKGSVNDPDTGDGQGANNLARMRAVTQLQAWLQGTPTTVVTDKVLLLGDFNAYAKEDPIAFLEGQGYTKLAPGQYSYGFQGLWGALDHVFASPALAAKVGNAVKWHINAEEPPVLDYNTNYKSPAQVAAYYADDAYRSSDHNPIVVGLRLDPPVVPVDPTDYEVQLPSGPALNLALASEAQCRFEAAPVVSAGGHGPLPRGLELLHAPLQWAATGCTPGGAATLRITYPEALPAGTQYWKWGPTAANPQPHWYSLPATVSGKVLTVQLSDGADGDDDLAANGRIADPGAAGRLAADPGPGTPVATPVPATGPAALGLLGGLLALAAAGVRRRRR